MADDNRQRSYRSNDPYRRDAERAGAHDMGSNDQGPASDPLAELARLIGQADPFADVGRSPKRAEGPRTDRYPAPPEPRAAHHAAPVPPSTPHDWRANEVPPDYDAGSEQSSAAPDWRRDATPPGYDPAGAEQAPSEDSYFRPRRSEPARQGGYHMPPADSAPDPYDQFSSSQPSHSYGLHHHEPQLAFDERLNAQDDAAYGGAARDDGRYDDAYYEEGAPPTGQDDDAYDDPPRRKSWRSGLATTLTLITCAMLGIAGAYGYRTYYAGPGSTQAPPVIIADRTPSKVIPAASEPQSTKSIQDRLGGDQGPGERVVPREEQPVDPRSLAPPPPRGVLPSPITSSQAQALASSAPRSAPIAVAPTSGGAVGSIGSTEPRRIRTIPIRQDGSDASSRPVGAFPPAASGSTPPARQAGRGAPTSLEPQASTGDPTPTPTAQRPAPAPRVAALPPQPASTSNASVGGYLVQVSSQRSEAEAQASFRALQAKYPNVLGRHELVVRRVDLGAKGVYYRAMVGPFSAGEEAVQLCSSLKAAGGQCLIQRN